MTVSCPDCRSVFRVDPAKVPATGVRARCSVCGGIIAVAGGTGPLRTPVRTPVSAGPMVSPSQPQPAFPTPHATAPATPHAANSATPHAAPAPVSYGATPASASPAPAAVATPVANPVGVPRTATPMTAPATVSPLAGAPPSAHQLQQGTPVRPMPPAPSSSASLSPVAPMAAPAAPSSATPRRTINPFLNADPGQRARRLARALVSDLVAYHPKKRDEGLAQGTLRQLFREDIKKSYEEYVEQVGRELAESSPHFQDALNDVLAGGQRLF